MIAIRNKLLPSYLIVWITLLMGCASNPKYIKFPVVWTKQVEVSDRIPLRAGLHIPSAFRNGVIPMYAGEPTFLFVGKSRLYVGKFGEALSKQAESMAKTAFQEVVILDQVEQANSEQVDIVISPKVDSIDLNYSMSTAAIKIQWTITDVAGRILYVNTLLGEGNGRNSGFKYQTKLHNACKLGIEDHFNKVFVAITETKWWEDL